MKLYYARIYNWQANSMSRYLLSAENEDHARLVLAIQLSPRDKVEVLREVCPTGDDVFMEVS